MRDQLKKALKLARKSKNPIIFFDAETPEDSFAIVDLDRYEEMISPEMLDKKEAVYKPGLTDGDLGDKINREISDWKNDENSQFLAEESTSRKNWNIPPQVKGKAQNISN
ncbi:MAG: hypothetical protein Q8Q67_02175 [bacterium]|nr:hypothetical protein [bacterium]